MSIEILVNVAPRETRAAILENGVVQELYIERPSRRGLVSNLYKGRVSRVLPGMQAAFVEIGLERTAFLHAADIARSSAEDTLISAWRSDSRNGSPDAFSFRSKRSVQSQSPQAQGSEPFWSWQLRRSCASCTRVSSKYRSQYSRSSCKGVVQ